MLHSVRTVALWGLEPLSVICEVDVGPGLPGFVMVGLPDLAVREVRDRLWPALRNAGFKVPDRRVTVNLAPAERRKEGASMDLAVALATLCATNQAPPDRLKEAAAIGEVALDGSLRAVRGTLSLAERAWRDGAHTLLCPVAGAPEAALVEPLAVHGMATLGEAVAWLRGEDLPLARPAPPEADHVEPLDLADIRGQALARRAIEIAAAGGHTLLMVGPPGTGKSLLAQRVPGILPPLDSDEALTVTRLHSAAGLRPPGLGLMRTRPYRSPHHTVTRAGLIGGGSPPHPGEISLAHHGVLFLDELPEFARSLLESLREPLETGTVHVVRASGSAVFPARALLVAAMNPCPCGWLGHARRGCRCTPAQLQQYSARVSGPVLDRLDLQVEVPALDSVDLLDDAPAEASPLVRARVVAARARQRVRGMLNGLLPNSAVREHAALDAAGRRLIADAVDRAGMSARAVHRALRVARTIADLEGEEHVTPMRLAEALQYRAYEAARFVAG